MSEVSKASKPKQKRRPLLTAVGILLCVVFGSVLICNLLLIIKSNLDPDEPPSVLGITPFTVLSGSMSGDREGHLEIGDLIFVQKVDASELKEGDVISFMANGSVTTHRIIEINKEDGQLQFITKGDANNTKDQLPVFEDQVVGRFLYRVPKVGNFVLFLREPLGMMLFIVVPLMLFIFLDVLTRRNVHGKREEASSELELENARLRAMLEEREAAPKLPEPTAAETPTAPPIIAAAPVVQAPVAPVPPPVVQAPPPAEVTPPPVAAAPVVIPPPAEPKVEAAHEFYIGEPPKASEDLLSAIYDGREMAAEPMAAPPVTEPPKAQESEEISLEEILAFARSLEAKKNQ